MTESKRGEFILFLTQVMLIFLVVSVALCNLSIGCDNPNFWTVVLTSCLGYIMPNPKLKLYANIKESTMKTLNLDEIGVGVEEK